MYARKPLFHAWGALDRGRFVAGILFLLGAVLTLALVTLNGNTAGGMNGWSTGIHVVLMLVLAALFLPLTLRRAFDLGWSVPKSCLAVIGSVGLFPWLTLVFMLLPGRTAPDLPEDAVPPLSKPAMLAAPFAGVLVGKLVSMAIIRLQ